MPRSPDGRRFRPQLWPTLIAALLIAVLIGLGTWQLVRLGWKADLVGTLQARLADEPVALPAEIDTPEAWDYRRVTVTGRYLDGSEFLLQSRVLNGEVGVHQVWPLEEEGSGRIVFVDRGWIPAERADQAARPLSEPATGGVVTVEGIARVPGEAGWMGAENDPAAQAWFRVSPRQMAGALGLDPATVAPVFVERSGSGEGLPVPGQTRLDLPNNHLQYALTWYALALVLLIIYVLSQRRAAGTGRPTPPEPDDEA